MSKITIGKKEYEVDETQLNQCELLFYEENPRVYSILRANGGSPTQKEVEEKMTSMEHVKQLKLSIEQNGGLIDPLIVIKKENDYIVLEGNSRLAAYRLLAQKDPVKWQKVRVQILPDTVSEDEIFTLLGQYHLVGRKDWSVFEQAAYLYRQKRASNLEIDTLAKSVGLSEGKVKTFISVYEFMLEHDDLKPDRWSYYEEYLKSRGVKKYRDTSPAIDEVFVKQVKSGAIKQAMDVRTVLGEVAKASDKTAKKVMQDFIEEKRDIYEAREILQATGKTTDNYKHIKKFQELICNTDVQNAIKLESTSNKDLIFTLKKIQKELDRLLKEYK